VSFLALKLCDPAPDFRNLVIRFLKQRKCCPFQDMIGTEAAQCFRRPQFSAPQFLA
jgi:hypothetical protein